MPSLGLHLGSDNKKILLKDIWKNFIHLFSRRILCLGVRVYVFCGTEDRVCVNVCL
jgi:hypothetical protein